MLGNDWGLHIVWSGFLSIVVAAWTVVCIPQLGHETALAAAGVALFLALTARRYRWFAFVVGGWLCGVSVFAWQSSVVSSAGGGCDGGTCVAGALYPVFVGLMAIPVGGVIAACVAHFVTRPRVKPQPQLPEAHALNSPRSR